MARLPKDRAATLQELEANAIAQRAWNSPFAALGGLVKRIWQAPKDEGGLWSTLKKGFRAIAAGAVAVVGGVAAGVVKCVKSGIIDGAYQIATGRNYVTQEKSSRWWGVGRFLLGALGLGAMGVAAATGVGAAGIGVVGTALSTVGVPSAYVATVTGALTTANAALVGAASIIPSTFGVATAAVASALPFGGVAATTTSAALVGTGIALGAIVATAGIGATRNVVNTIANIVTYPFRKIAAWWNKPKAGTEPPTTAPTIAESNVNSQLVTDFSAATAATHQQHTVPVTETPVIPPIQMSKRNADNVATSPNNASISLNQSIDDINQTINITANGGSKLKIENDTVEFSGHNPIQAIRSSAEPTLQNLSYALSLPAGTSTQQMKKFLEEANNHPRVTITEIQAGSTTYPVKDGTLQPASQSKQAAAEPPSPPDATPPSGSTP